VRFRGYHPKPEADLTKSRLICKKEQTFCNAFMTILGSDATAPAAIQYVMNAYSVTSRYVIEVV